MGNRIIPGINDLETINPRLASEWNYEKNGELKPNMIAPKSNRKVWWKCSNGHEWINSPNGRGNNGCPYCSNQLLLSGYNDLATVAPSVLEEWDYEKNEGVDPTMIQAGSERKVWWKCPNGHSYIMQIDRKAKYGHNCPVCSKGRHVSFPEKAAAYYFQKVDTSIIEGYSNIDNGITELDLYCQERQFAVEYDGKRWHALENIDRDIQKNKICRDLGIELYRIRENGCAFINDSCSKDIYYDAGDYSTLGRIIKSLIADIYDVDCDIDIERDKIEIYKKIDIWFNDNSAENLPAEKLAEWDCEKNLGLQPNNFSKRTHKKVWWTCHICGGSWQASIANRAYDRGCPYCSGHKLLSGFNDLQTLNPELAKEWDHDKNNFDPNEITSHSGSVVWWKCPKGHSYKAKVSNRNDLKRGCPICANRIIIPGVNDLATMRPELIVEWDFDKNEVSPHEISVGANKKVWWKCPKGHSYCTTVGHRTGSKKTGCPVCAELRKGETLKKAIIQYDKNGVIIREFDSAKEAELFTGVSRSSICNNLKNKTKTAGGFVWKYKNPVLALTTSENK